MIRAALIGCGSFGGVHSENIGLIDGIEMVAFCDVVEERAREFRSEYDGEYSTADPGRIYEDDSIDAVYVCTRHDSHAEHCIRAAENGKHVMVEKPLALTSEDCLSVYEAVEANDITLMTAFKMRFFELIQKAKELLPDPIIVTMQMMDNRWPADSWANDQVAGGGNVISQGVHSTDVIRYVAGSDPVCVSAEGGNYYQETGVIDNMVAVYRFEDGTIGNLVQGDANCPTYTSKFFLQAFDENRSVTLTDRFCKLVYEENGETKVYRGEETGPFEENRAFRDAIKNGDSAPVDHVDGFFATAMILNGFEAIESGQTTAIQLPVASPP